MSAAEFPTRPSVTAVRAFGEPSQVHGAPLVESIASGPGAALTFTESSASRVGRISTR